MDMAIKVFIMIIIFGIMALWLYRSTGVGKYSCEICDKKFSEPITNIELIDLARPNKILRQIKEIKYIKYRCPKCGAEMPVEAKYCGICGTKMPKR